MSETHSRTIVKSITWRIIATLIAAYWVGFQIAIIMNIVQTVAYYFHERSWIKIKWGKTPNE